MKPEELTLSLCITASLVLVALTLGNILTIDPVHSMIPAIGAIAFLLVIKAIEATMPKD